MRAEIAEQYRRSGGDGEVGGGDFEFRVRRGIKVEAEERPGGGIFEGESVGRFRLEDSCRHVRHNGW